MRVLITGATGFVGSQVTRVLIDQGCEVTALVRPTSKLGGLVGRPVKRTLGDLTDCGSIRRVLEGINVLFHVAADYRFWVPDPHTMYEINVSGTERLLEAAWKAGVERIVYTSSAVTVRCSDSQAGTEQDFLTPAEARSLYQRTKILAEQAAWRLIGEGAPITIVNPSTPIGAGDGRPTPTGRLILDFLKGRLPAFLDAVFNFVDVRDVAFGHWLAAIKGQVGQRYILGHETISLSAFLEMLSTASGLPVPRIKIPYAVAYLAGAFGELFGRATGRESRATLDGVRMAGIPMHYDSSKAVKELGLPQTPVYQAVMEAVRWYRQQGYVTHGGSP
jgi:dihydroflavonol-4-reductase